MGSPQKEKNTKFGEVLDYRDTEEAKQGENMKDTRFGEIYTYENTEEARRFLGKKGVFSDFLKGITENPLNGYEGTLEKVEDEELCPFCVDNINNFQFFRPILEEELMTNYQLAEWLAKGHGQCCRKDIKTIPYSTTWEYDFKSENSPVMNKILIRRWNTIEWVRPTRSIYEEDCMTSNIYDMMKKKGRKANEETLKSHIPG